MAMRNGTNVGSPITTFTDQDKYATAFADEIQGGWHIEADTTARNAIPKDRRKIGMACTTSDGKRYILKTDAGNVTTLDTDWEEDVPEASDIKTKSGSTVEDALTKVGSVAADKTVVFVIAKDDVVAGENYIEQSIPAAGKIVSIAMNVQNDTILSKDASIQIEQYNGIGWSVVGSAIIAVGSASKDVTNTLKDPVPVKAMDRLRVNIQSIQDGVKSINVLVGIQSTI